MWTMTVMMFVMMFVMMVVMMVVTMNTIMVLGAELGNEKELATMRVKELKVLLAKKGDIASCVACTTKQEFVDRVLETADWAEVSVEASSGDVSVEDLQKLFKQSQDNVHIDSLREKLKAAGIDTSKILSSDDIIENLAKEGGWKDSNKKKDGDTNIKLEGKHEEL